ncbi:unnamed protein product [Leptidea sinapis]|uniref:Uncharacterized protein n=1 Tax=Leptidea sinapis TaxID=189913 RepID=A0A5E4R7H5_9NEOP|nr:unnamed protein product [Leptidea sinapis]
MDDKLKARHSFNISNSDTTSIDTKTFSKSDVDIKSTIPEILIRSDIESLGKSCGEYYKKYDHEEIPVKDDTSNDNSYREDRMFGDYLDSVTNFEHKNFEIDALRKLSVKLQSSDTAVTNLDSHIQLFKSTVTEIFDNFYTCMKDYEDYKRKYNEILSKTKNESMTEMKQFIEDMIENLSSSELLVKNSSKTSVKNECEVDTNDVTVEAYKNDNYLTDSTFDNGSHSISNVKNEDTRNMYHLGHKPCVSLKMSDRILLSEINIREPSRYTIMAHKMSSANDFKKMAQKVQEIYTDEQQNLNAQDRNIPIKISHAKKDIPLDEDFVDNETDEHKSFFFKICNYLRKKFCKNL